MTRQKLFRWRYALIAFAVLAMATGMLVVSPPKALADNPTFSCPDGTIIQPQTGATCQNPGPPGSNNLPVTPANNAPANTSQDQCTAQADGTIFKNGKCVGPSNNDECQKAIPGSHFEQGTNGSPNRCTGTDPCNFPQWALRWAACPIVEVANQVTDTLNKFIFNYLYIDTNAIFGNTTSGNGIYQAWSTFRNLGVGLIVIAALVMIVSEAIGFDLVDAYTIRKVLPRLLIAALGITLSWAIMGFMVKLFNDLGSAVGDLVTSPFTYLAAHDPNAANIMTTTIQWGFIIGALWLLGPLGILSFIGTIMLALAIGAMVLLFRQMVIILAVIISPFAIAAFVLPNTKKMADFTWDSFLTALIMFPLIVGFLSLGKVMSAIMATSKDFGSSIASIIFYFLPYALLPVIARASGGIMSTVTGMVNDKSKGGFDRLKKYRQNEFGQRYEHKVSRPVLQKRADMVSSLQQRASQSGTSAAGRFAYRRLAGAVGGYNVEAAASTRRATVGKELNDQIATGRDEEIRGLTVNRKWADAQGPLVDDGSGNRTNGYRRVTKDGTLQYKSLGGTWIDDAHVRKGQQRWGNDTFAQQAALSYEMRKATSEEQLQGLATNFNTLAQGEGSWGLSDSQSAGMWLGSAFENQNQHLEFKKTNWKTGSLDPGGQAGFVDEVYEKKGSYPLAQMSSNTIQQLKESYVAAQGSGNVQQQEKIAAIAQTFMHEMGAGGRQYGVGPGNGDQPLVAPPAGGGAVPGLRQANTPGAAHVAERVRELAELTGVYAAAPAGNYTPGPGRPSPTPNGREQN